MDFGEPAPDVIARLYNEIKEKKVWIGKNSFIIYGVISLDP